MKNPAALDFLATRRSVPPKAIGGPAPGRAELEGLLTIAMRVPDHGMLTPWRLIVLEERALRRVAGRIAAAAEAAGMDGEAVAKGRAVYDTSPLAVVVVSSPVASEKIPRIEQVHSAGNVCLSLVNAALAAGWAAGWVTGWAAHDARILPAVLGLTPDEKVAGVVHIGTAAPSPERPRPDLADRVSWLAG
jgi:nitroreductase